jgi:predicted  nucleic acid-binding Zn-ribbon protein
MHAETIRRFNSLATQSTRIERNTMALQEDLDAVAAEITTATAAVVAEIDALEAQIAAGVTPDLTGLRAAAAALDAVAVPPAA